MAENFQSSNWRNTSRASSFNSSSPTPSSSLSSSTTIASVTTAPFMDSSLHLSSLGLSSSSMDWTQPLLSNSSGRAENCNFHAMFQETATDSREPSGIPFRDMNQPFLLETGECSRGTENFLFTSSSFFDHQQMNNYQSQMIDQKRSDINQLQFTSNSNFWNASDAAMNEVGTVFCSSSDDVLFKPFDLKPAGGCSNLTVMSSEGAKEKKMSNKYAMKKPRMETPSPSPIFKVRKEKLGDRITALQQLVSPFGKTDTASVLQEVIDHIKLLHDKVNVLITPYLKNGNPMQQHQQSSDKSEDGKQDLRSRGLCLVPISSAYPVAGETSADFWTLTFGGTYR